MMEKTINIGYIQPILGDPELKTYYCPHCKKIVLRGDIKTLNMVCPNCFKLILAEERELVAA